MQEKAPESLVWFAFADFFIYLFFAINGLIVWKTNSKLLFTHVGSVSVFQSTSQT